MPPISFLTPQNSYLFSLLMVWIVVIASFTSNSKVHLIKRLVSMVSSHRNLSRHLCILLTKAISRISISLPYRSSMTSLAHFLGWTMTNKSVMYNGPPPSLALIQPPSIPPISTLVMSIIALLDRLFFISHSLGNPSACKWRLVRFAFSDSTALSPSCLQDGHFLVKFYTLHHDDVRFNAINQRYWLQCHSLGNLTTPTSATTTHLICPSNTSEALAMKQKLVPFC
jgi:hypothetical protein